MAEVHLVTVGSGDCTIIRHGSGRVSMIDICGGNRSRATEVAKQSALIEELLKAASGNPKGNYRMCEKLTHPFDYIEDKGLTNIFRFISTHPDMDHLDGFDSLSRKYGIQNFWHSGASKNKPDFSGSPYQEADWDRYISVKNGEVDSTTSLKVLDGKKFKYANESGDDGEGSGDYIDIASPSQGLVDEADNSQNYNDASFIIVYRMAGGKVVICGDAEDGAFNHAIEKYPKLMKDVGLLLAPHHGRDSGRDYRFLDHLNPRFTLLGCAPHAHHRTTSWTSRGLSYCKQNQCGNMIAKPGTTDGTIDLYIQNKSFAENSGGDISKVLYDDLYFYRTI